MSSLRISTQIYLAVGSVLALLALLAGQSYLATDKLAGIFGDYKETTQQTLIANQLFEDVFDAQFAALNYRLSASSEEIQIVVNSVDKIAERRTSAMETFADNEEALARLWRIGKFAEQYQEAFAQMIKLNARSDKMVSDLETTAARASSNLSQIMDHAADSRDVSIIFPLSRAQQDFLRGLSYHDRYLVTDDAQIFDQVGLFLDKVTNELTALRNRIDDPGNADLVTAIVDDIAAYKKTIWRNRDVMTMHNEMRDRKLDTLGPLIKQDAEDLIRLVTDEQLKLGADGASRTGLTLLQVALLSVSAFGIGCLLAVLVSRRISQRIRSMAHSMTDLANGDLDIVIRDTDKKHELGLMARALEVFKVNAIQLQQSLDKERELSGLQRQFVSMVSHEFRTPLAIIDAHAQRILRRGGEHLPAPAVAGVAKIRRAVKSLTELMESVLVAARMEDGCVQFDPKPCLLPDLIDEIAKNHRELNSDRKIHLDIDRLPQEIMADGKLLRQVFSNLISNALKYSPGKKDVWLEGWSGDKGEIVISVRDEGVGIPQAEQEKLFSRFFRASTSAGIAGTGIGLHLVAHLVQLHNGSVDVESVEGEGTTFRVTLPSTRPALPADDDNKTTRDPALAQLAGAAV